MQDGSPWPTVSHGKDTHFHEAAMSSQLSFTWAQDPASVYFSVPQHGPAPKASHASSMLKVLL